MFVEQQLSGPLPFSMDLVISLGQHFAGYVKLVTECTLQKQFKEYELEHDGMSKERKENF